MCPDVLRAISRKPGDFAAVLACLQALGGGDARVAASLRKLQDALALPPEVREAEARRFTTRPR